MITFDKGYPICSCDGCLRALTLQAQLNVPNPPTQYSDYYKFDYPLREMTAEDLGLPTTLPYAFWLGAEAA